MTVLPLRQAVLLDRWFARRLMRQEVILGHKPGVITFTFDDAFRTACDPGGRILSDYGCRGTYYVAGALTGKRKDGMDCHTREDLEGLLAKGHQVGCHTFSHASCYRLPPAEVDAELDQNAAFLAGLGLPPDRLHFAFPQGAYGLIAKRLCASRFQSLRITGGGVQTGRADLNALKSEPLFEPAVRPDRLKDLSRQTAVRRGWLIFHSHDVQNNPSPRGCFPRTLEAAVRIALDAGCRVLTVAEAIDYWRSRDQGVPK
jgi:peptidoglycan/xylan/chitin deacetylase (PgdA/CDA1 family)